MSVIPTPVSNNDNGYFFALKNDPGVGQTLSLTGDTLAISGGNSVNVGNATTVSTSKVKLTAQTYIAGFNTTNFTGDVRSEGRVTSAPPLGNGTATLNGSLANVTITGIAGNNPSVLFEKSVDKASIVYNGTDILMSTIKVSTISVKAELYDSFGSPGAAGQQLQSSGPGLGTVWGAGSGVGLTAVIAGSNIGVDNTNPIAPVVNLAISSDLAMNGNNITSTGDIGITAATGIVDIKASVSAANPTLKLTNTDTSISASLNYDGSSVNLKAPDVPLYLTKTDSLGAAETSLIVSASGNVLIEAATPTLTFSETATPATATVALSGTTLTATSDSVVLQNTAGNVKLEVVDSALNNVIVMSANGGVNRLSVFGAETYVGGANPTLRFNNDSSATQADIAFNGTTLALTNANNAIDISPNSVSIQTNNADTSISMSVAGGNAGLTVSDIGGFNNIEASAAGANLTVGNAIDPIPSIIMSANGSVNQLKVTDNRTDIIGDTGFSAPLLKFVDSSTVVPPFEMTLVNDGANSGVRMTYFDSSAVPATIVKFQDNGVYIVGDALGTGYVPQLHFKDIGYNTNGLLSLNGNNFQLNADVFTVAATNTVNITSGFTDVTLTASLGQIYQLGGQRVRTRFVSSAFYNPVVSDYAICMENAGGSTLTLPLITAANVGKQYLILHNSTSGAVSVQTALGSGQTIFSSTGAASANPRSLPIGHCHTFTAMQVSGFPVAYGWAMI